MSQYATGTFNPTPFSEIPVERPVFFWPSDDAETGLIARKTIHMVGGKTDRGKGNFCARVSADVSNMTFDGRPGRVLHSAAEDPAEVMTGPRLRANGANLRGVYHERFWLPEQNEDFTLFVWENQIDLVVMDPLAGFLSNGVRRSDDSIRRVSAQLQRVAENANCAVLIVDHTVKRIPKDADPVDAIGGGASGMRAAARMIFIWGENPDNPDQRVLANVKANILREKRQARVFEIEEVDVEGAGGQPRTIMLPDPIDFDPKKLLLPDADGAGRGRPPTKFAECCEWLSRYLFLADKPVLASTIYEDAKHQGFSQKLAKKACKHWGLVVNPPTGKNCAWTLPDELRKAMLEQEEALRRQQEAADVEVEPLLTDEDLDRFRAGLLPSGDVQGMTADTQSYEGGRAICPGCGKPVGENDEQMVSLQTGVVWHTACAPAEDAGEDEPGQSDDPPF